jgi:hypothetical protein
MSEDQATQTVVNPADAPPPAGSEAAGARTNGDDLDTLLNQYEQETRPAAPSPTEPKPAATTAPAAATQDTRFERFIYRQDMDKLIDTVRGDLPAEVFDNDLIESWVDTQARRDPRLQQAWINRHENPRQFEQVKSALGREFAKKMGKLPDRQATEDREAVAAAVRGASRAPVDTPPNFAALNDADFQKAKETAFGG